MDANLRLNVLAASAAVISSLVQDDELQEFTLTTLETGVAIDLRCGGGADTFHHEFPNSGYPDIANVAFYLFLGMQDFVMESSFAWGQPRPLCPGHSHPRRLIDSGGELWWACPRPQHTEPAFPHLTEPDPARH